MLSLSEFRSKNESLSDLLNYAFQIDNGLLLNKDGSLAKTWSFFGEDAHSSTPYELDLISTQITRALNYMESGWMIHIDAIRSVCDRYPKDNNAADATTAIIDAERKIQFSRFDNYYESRYFITITYLPPLLVESKTVDLFIETEGENVKNKKTDLTKKHIKHFESITNEVIELMKSVLNINNLNAGEDQVYCDQLSYINGCIIGKQFPLRNPGSGMPIDVLVGSQDFIGGLSPQIENQHIRVVAIDGYPPHSYPTILRALDEYAGEYRWSSRFIFMDHLEAELELKKYQRKWKQKIRGFFDQIMDRHTGNIDEDASKMAGDTSTALSELNSGLVKYGFFTSVVVIYRDTREQAEDDAKEIRNLIRTNGFNARIELANTVAAWLGSLPCHGYPNVSRPPLHTMNLADMLPTTSVWPGKRVNPCNLFPPNTPPLFYANTNGRTPFRFHLHVGDVGHMFIFGPTGTGKSTFLGFMMSQFLVRYKKPKVIMFDKDASSYALCKAVGGTFYDIGADKSINFAPLSRLETPSDKAWAAEFVELLLTVQNVQVKSSQRTEIFRALELLANSSKQHRSMTEYVTTIQDKEIQEALRHYTLDGAYGHLLDAEQDHLEENRMSVFELAHLMNLSEKILLPVMFYLFRTIDRQLDGTYPTLIVIDEAWLPLRYEYFATKIDEWLRVLRKKHASVVMASQKINDANQSTIASSIIESCLSKIYLPNANISSEEVIKQYKSLGLNDKQINIIRTAISKRQYYYVSPLGKRLFSLALGKVALAFVGLSAKESAHIKELEKTHQGYWVQQWLNEQGLSDWSPYWTELFSEFNEQGNNEIEFRKTG